MKAKNEQQVFAYQPANQRQSKASYWKQLETKF